MLDMKKVTDLLLTSEDLKDVPVYIIFKVINSLFYIINNERL